MTKSLYIWSAVLVVLSLSMSIANAADPGHSASRIGSGTFESGNYVFPANLSVANAFNVTSTFIVNLTGAITATYYPSCTALETDANGLIVCGSDASGTDTTMNTSSSDPYLYNDSTTMFFNETYLNATIDDRDSDNYPGDDFVNETGDEMTGTLNMSNNSIYNVSSMYMGTSEGNHYFYFYEDGSPTGESFYWDNANDKFYFTDLVESADGFYTLSNYQGFSYQASGDIYGTAATSDLWLGTLSQASAKFKAYGDGSMNISDGAFEVNTTGGLTMSIYPSCNLETDANGLVTCGTDDTGSSTTMNTSSADPYLYNDTATIFFNSTYNNATINSIDTATNASIKAYVDNQGFLTSESDPHWTANQSLYPTMTTIEGWGYYNSSDFDIADYYLLSNPYAYYNSTTIPTYLQYATGLTTANITSITKDDILDSGALTFGWNDSEVYDNITINSTSDINTTKNIYITDDNMNIYVLGSGSKVCWNEACTVYNDLNGTWFESGTKGFIFNGTNVKMVG